VAVKPIPDGFHTIISYLTLLTLILFLGISCNRDKSSLAQKEKDTAADQEYLKNAGAEWDSLFNSGDVISLAALYAENVISMPFAAPTIYGRQALQADFENFLANNTAEHKTDIDEILTGDDWAVERAHYLLTYTSKTSGNVVIESGRHVVCRKKIDGRWQIAWEIWNTDKPPQQ
jgi:ketosteroid isomerase-like protein